MRAVRCYAKRVEAAVRSLRLTRLAAGGVGQGG